MVSLLARWVQYHLRDSGYYFGSSAFLRERVDCYDSTRNRGSGYDGSTNLWGFSIQEFERVDAEMARLAKTDRYFYAAISMYYKPWTIQSLQAQGYPFNPSKTYYRRLHLAHAWLAEALSDILHSEKPCKQVEYACSV